MTMTMTLSSYGLGTRVVDGATPQADEQDNVHLAAIRARGKIISALVQGAIKQQGVKVPGPAYPR